MALLEVKNLVKQFDLGFGKVDALKGVHLNVEKGEFLCIMGASGSGKSTLLHILGGLDNPTSGEIFLDGIRTKDFHQEPKATEYRREKIGFIFQSFNLLNALTAEENISLPLILSGMRYGEIKEKTRRLLNMVGLYDQRNQRPNFLSGGQQQRVALARALIHEPSILLADEPTGNLDSETSSQMLKLLKTTQLKLNQTIILVTHDPEVAVYSDRVLFFRDGSVVSEYINFKEKSAEVRNLEILGKFRDGFKGVETFEASI
jgi:putative ABC transport system ATP-binding protein